MPVALSEEAKKKLNVAAPCRTNITAFIGDLAVFRVVSDSFFACPNVSDELWEELQSTYGLKTSQKEIIEKLLLDKANLKPRFEAIQDELNVAMKKLREPCWPCR